MLREGPIPRVVHGLIEYAVGVFLIAAPFLLGYDDVNMPLGVSIATGVVILVLAAITEGPTGLVKQLPVSAHVTFDFLLAVFLIAAPFILGFNDESTPRNLFITLGVFHLLVSIGTRYRDAAPAVGDARPASRAKRPPSPAPSASPPSATAPTSPPSATAPTSPPSTSAPASPPKSSGTGSTAVDGPATFSHPSSEPPPTTPAP